MDKPASKTFLRGISLSYLEFFVRLALGLVMTPVILGYLGKAGYGLWASLGSMVGYFGIFNINFAVVKYVAEYRAQGRRADLSKLISSILGIFGVIGGVILLTFVALNSLIPGFFHLSPEWAPAARLTFVIMGLNLVCGLLTGVFANIIYGHERVDVQKSFTIMQALVTNSLILLFLHLGFGLVGVAAAATLGWLALMVSCVIYISRRHYGISVHSRFLDFKLLKEIAPYSIRTQVLALCAQVLYNTDNLVIGVILGVITVTPYEIGYKLCFMAVTMMYMVSNTLFPSLSRLYASGDLEGLRNLYLKIANFSVNSIMILSLFLVSCGREFIAIWVGPENVLAQRVFFVLVSLNLVHAVAGPAGQLLLAIGRNRLFTFSALADAILNLGLSILLCRKIGLVGVPLGTLIAHLLTDSWVVTWLACRYIGLSFKKYLLSGILPPLLAAVPVGAVLLFLPSLPWVTLLSLAVKGIIISTIYLSSCLLVYYFMMRLGVIPAVRFSLRSMLEFG